VIRAVPVAVLAALVAAALAGCGGLKKGGFTPVGAEEATKSPSEVQTNPRIAMKGNSFSPATVRARPGSTVTWVNRDRVAHNVTQGDELYNRFTSGEVEPGKTFRKTFNKEQRVGYRCTIHPNMQGTLFVKKEAG